MNIQYFEHKGQKLISCNFFIPVGLYTTYGKKGSFAHLIEHLIFKGHPQLTQQELMQKIEKNGGIMNALTDENHMEIYLRITEDKLYESIKLIYESISEFDITSADILNEYSIIKIEEADEYIDELILQTVLDQKEKLCTGDFSFTEIKQIYQKFYQLEDWYILILGEIQENTKFLIEKLMKGNRKYIPHNTYKSYILPKERQYMEMEIEDKEFFIYFHKCTEKCDKMIVKMIKYLLFSGLSSFFYQKLVDENGFTYNINIKELYHDGISFIIYFSFHDILFENIVELFETVFSNSDFLDKTTDNEINRIINMTITDYYLKEESVSSIANDIIESTLEDKTFLTFTEIISFLKQLTVEETKNMIKQALYGAEELK